MAVASPDNEYVDDALELLVNQFADPLSFVRELVQNSIDAGSEEIDVSCEFTPGRCGRLWHRDHPRRRLRQWHGPGDHR